MYVHIHTYVYACLQLSLDQLNFQKYNCQTNPRIDVMQLQLSLPIKQETRAFNIYTSLTFDWQYPTLRMVINIYSKASIFNTTLCAFDLHNPLASILNPQALSSYGSIFRYVIIKLFILSQI